MKTPICDFVRRYAESGNLRLHMPGHKGMSFLGMEQRDITEIPGADSLYEAEGIIAESERNASKLFGCPTVYSTEGSSQCIRAMLYLAVLYARQQGRRPVILAGRNAHKTFLSAAALLDLEVQWLYPEDTESYLSCTVSPEALDEMFWNLGEKPTAVYLTSPDYLGKIADIREIAEVCHSHGCLLIVDNAHGAYLKFLGEHPIALGADLCCDSAHKTLPVLTGGAYLHIAPDAPGWMEASAKKAMVLFGSTSPSYLILQSLDQANVYLEDYAQRLGAFLPEVAKCKTQLTAAGYMLYGQEPMKITIAAKPYGYLGTELAWILQENGIVCEFADPDYLVLMPTPETGRGGMTRLQTVLLGIPQRPSLSEKQPQFHKARQALSIREAALSPTETIPVKESCGRILGAATVGCPPAVPILVCGEQIDDHAIACFQYYGIDTCEVVIP